MKGPFSLSWLYSWSGAVHNECICIGAPSLIRPQEPYRLESSLLDLNYCGDFQQVERSCSYGAFKTGTYRGWRLSEQYGYLVASLNPPQRIVFLFWIPSAQSLRNLNESQRKALWFLWLILLKTFHDGSSAGAYLQYCQICVLNQWQVPQLIGEY